MTKDKNEMENGIEEQLALAQRLREAREYLGLSQEVVAQKLKVPRASISAMESGRRKVSSLELRDMARLYRTSVDRLLGIESDTGEESDASANTLFRAARQLSAEDRQQVLRFAEFLKESGRAPSRGSRGQPS